MDIVQDAMLTLAQVCDETRSQWPPLFFRILRNRITDPSPQSGSARHLRDVTPRDRDDDTNPIDLVSDGRGSRAGFRTRLSTTAATRRRVYPHCPRQREAFLLRAWEGLDVAATAG
jgi:RNA polymerase sigma-70 factor (ECF subfamily)